eukprot:Gb_11403 [translate_table: standard]
MKEIYPLFPKFCCHRARAFFYGASRNNPGMASLGGLLVIPQHKCKISYWENLGISSNNVAECKALRKGLQLLMGGNVWRANILEIHC